MRLLVTRPSANAAPLAERLAAQGHNVIISPVIEIYSTQTELPALTASIGGLAFTSANGVYALAARLHDETLRGLWQALPAFAVGPQTAAALRALGWHKIHQAEGDVAALAETIKAAHHKDDGIIVHMSGRHRAGNLAAALADADIDYSALMLYEAEAADELSHAAKAALGDTQEPLDGVIIYSQRSADLYVKLSQTLDMAKRPTAYCLSPAIAALMQAQGYDTRIAATPDEAGMLALLSQSQL